MEFLFNYASFRAIDPYMKAINRLALWEAQSLHDEMLHSAIFHLGLHCLP